VNTKFTPDLDESERIDLLRGEGLVTSLAGAFGGGIKETRVTALLGYLMALDIQPFLELFRFPGIPQTVRLENYHDLNRSDILVETTKGIGIIEAKIDATDAWKQAKKYSGQQWAVLLSSHRPSANQIRKNRIRYVHWEELAQLLRRLNGKANPKVRFIAADLLNYLERYNMIKEHESVEIYAREINEPATLTLFLKSCLYGCWYEKNSRIARVNYFAPYFGGSLARTLPGIHVGISYISRIEKMVIIEQWKDFIDSVKTIRGGAWFNSHEDEITALLKKWDWKTKRKRIFLFLAEPRFVFAPPVQKRHLQKGIGRLNKRFLSFDELFKAWAA